MWFLGTPIPWVARPMPHRPPRARGGTVVRIPAVTAGELNAVAGRGGRLVHIAFEGQSGFPVYFDWEFEK